ncbi:MAG: 2-succinyl-5-enolpyruvyl-6-hydroxy-3-cyclohexene-1-carboxylic-acid synthase [Halanaeroarchaeum sp.]
MSAPNRNTLWAGAIVDELVAAGVEAVVVAPGSRSTPLTVAAAGRDDLAVFSHLDERSAAYFALGRGKRTGEPTAIVSTSGTAAVNFHPAVVEASQARVPLIVLTADRPPELRDSGANQTIDQEKLYGDAVRWYKDLPEPEPRDRKLRSLRTDVARAVGTSVGIPAGPVHLNVPFRKPLEPVRVEGDVPDAVDDLPGATGRGGPFVEWTRSTPTVDEGQIDEVASALADADRPLIVAGPDDADGVGREAIARLAASSGSPLLADPLSGARFGDHVDDVTVIGGYDGFLSPEVTDEWPDPAVVLRFGASPTSKALRTYLADSAVRQFLVDPAGEWREATFTATDLVVADPTWLAETVADTLAESRSATPNRAWHDRLETADEAHWEAFDETSADDFEGAVLGAVVEEAPDPATVVVSNSMPVRDLDRFGRPRSADLAVLGNRGASGIDGVTSTALGAGSATDDPLVLVTGDLAYFHDTTGLLALSRFGLSATIVLVDNRGGGIFHMLPIEDFDPPFTEQFKTPHDVDFAPTAEMFGFEFVAADDHAEFRDAYRGSVRADGTQVIAVSTDAEGSHRTRESLKERVVDRLS